jgi:hypothetical protein
MRVSVRTRDGGEHPWRGGAGGLRRDGVMPELLAVYHLFADPGMRIE